MFQLGSCSPAIAYDFKNCIPPLHLNKFLLTARENSELRAAHARLAVENASLGKTTKALEHSLRLLQKEVADLRGAQAGEIAALNVQLDQERRALREELARFDDWCERENAALRK
jgi:hypothetical protein